LTLKKCKEAEIISSLFPERHFSFKDRALLIVKKISTQQKQNTSKLNIMRENRIELKENNLSTRQKIAKDGVHFSQMTEKSSLKKEREKPFAFLNCDEVIHDQVNCIHLCQDIPISFPYSGS